MKSPLNFWLGRRIALKRQTLFSHSEYLFYATLSYTLTLLELFNVRLGILLFVNTKREKYTSYFQQIREIKNCFEEQDTAKNHVEF